MNHTPLSWNAFKQALLQNPELDLNFQYAADKRVNASYHITEIKQAPITSVDCGGVMNKWTEVIVQLWEPDNATQQRAMKVAKALSIIGVVEKMLPLDADAVVKIEFGNSGFDTRQMFPNDIRTDGDSLLIDLRPDTVQCKANDRGQTCGPNTSDRSTSGKSKIVLSNLAATGCCTPGSGCC
ncbi:MAG TPA: DUF6428 family protein [Mucilaginibacter sp.]|nr:DUF6428 family protein [Mucilaginibacter sp.]